jgi:hypothetical protein
MAGPNSTNANAPDLTSRIREHLPYLKRLNEVDASLKECLRGGADLLRKAGTEVTYQLSRIPPPVLLGGMAIGVALVSGCVSVIDAYSSTSASVPPAVHFQGVINCMHDYYGMFRDTDTYYKLNLTQDVVQNKLPLVYNYTRDILGQEGIDSSTVLKAYETCRMIPNYLGALVTFLN